MNKENKKYKLNYLSAEFYKKYSADKYPEIENKENRPYMDFKTQQDLPTV